MAAGLGFKTFTTGEVLTAADTNGYLMQGVLVFATAAARDAAITSPQEGQFAFTKDTNGLWYYDGAAWVASGATGDIEGVTAGVGISGGGTSGTVTVTNSMATEITAAGDIIVGTGSGTFDNLPIGTTAQVLTADTTVSPYKVKWATPTSGGMTQLATGTLSGASLNLTSISGSYKHLQLEIYGMDWATGAENVRMTINGLSTAAYGYAKNAFNNTTAGNYGTQGGTYWDLNDAVGNTKTGGKNHWTFTFFDYSASAYSVLMKTSYNYENTNGYFSNVDMVGSYQGLSAAINQITVVLGSGASYTAGTYILYGVA